MRERYDGNEQRVLPRKSVVTLLEVRNGESTERLRERTVAGVVSEQHGSARNVRLRGAHPARDPLQRLPAARHDDEELDVRNDAGLGTASDGSERLSTPNLRYLTVSERPRLRGASDDARQRQDVLRHQRRHPAVSSTEVTASGSAEPFQRLAHHPDALLVLAHLQVRRGRLHGGGARHLPRRLAHADAHGHRRRLPEHDQPAQIER